MEVSLAFGSFFVVLGACAVAAKNRCTVRLHAEAPTEPSGEPGFLRRLTA
jgi:hypothetical protein